TMRVMSSPADNSGFPPAASFATTHWSLVLAAREPDDSASRQALAELCQAYWYPIYAYVRRRVADVHEARDRTQAFFERLLEKGTLATADPARGRFRAFLLTACKRFLINEWHREHAARRGGECRTLSLDFDLGDSRYTLEPADTLSPERLFERQWAMTLLGRVLEKLREECEARDKLRQFEVLKQFLTGSERSDAYRAAADELGLTHGAVKVAAHRLRQRYRELLRSEIAQTVETADEVDEEIRSLFEILGS
ncbi:MAG TPA: sigma-70 family RNA polymerase sigma factor, partial [Planctomycetaceae bacterium]|nr:sigma-70 family RNA polymerase sigma factor [Planctomycetaceae bacterium]